MLKIFHLIVNRSFGQILFTDTGIHAVDIATVQNHHFSHLWGERTLV